MARNRSAWRTAASATLLAVSVFPGCRKAEVAPARPVPAPPGEPAPEATVEWVRRHATPFRTEDPATGDDGDLAFLDQAVGNARVVALGEATHGTHQFFAMKHRLVEYLVRRQGFRVFAMEADGAGSCAIDQYVRTGEGNPAQLIRDLKFWTWSTEEFLSLIRWMRDYNRTVSSEQRVSFRGIDMQNFFAASRRVVSFLGTVDPPAAQRAESAYRCLGPLEDHDEVEEQYFHRDIVEQMKCAAGIESVQQQISRNRARYEPASPQGYSCALWSAHLMQQAEMLLKFPSTRDHLYAENLLSLAADPREKVIVWAHNGHVGNILGAMGRRLKRQLGPDYLMVGFTAYGGSFRARTRQPDGGAGPAVPIAAPPPAADSYEDAFHRTGLPRFVLDLRRVKNGDSSPSWLPGPHPLRSVGGAYDAQLANSPSRLPEEFDLFIFFDRGDPSIPLPQDPRSAKRPLALWILRSRLEDSIREALAGNREALPIAPTATATRSGAPTAPRSKCKSLRAAPPPAALSAPPQLGRICNAG